MTERDYMKRLAAIFNAVAWCKMRILYDSGKKDVKKPYDAFLIYRGKHISIEGKAFGGKLEPHQKTALSEDIAAGGVSLVAWFNSVHVAIENYRTGAKVYYAWLDLNDPKFVEMVLRGLLK